MTGGRLLSYWRQRWAKPSFSDQFQPYAQGRLAKLIDRLQRGHLLQRDWFLPTALTFGLYLASVAVLADFSASDQTLFATALFAAAFVLQRQSNPALSLMLAVLSLIVSLRYLDWRVRETLPAGGWALVLGLALWIAEVGVSLTRVTRWCVGHWPLMRAPVTLPLSALDWPVLTAIVLCGETPAEQISICLDDLLAQDWPRQRLRIWMVVPGHRPELASLAPEEDVYVEVLTQDPVWRLNPRDERLGPTELIWLIRTPDAMPADLSRQCIGWFLRDPALGWLHPAPADRWPGAATRPALAARDMEWIRRSALPAAGAAAPSLMAQGPLRKAGQREAWITWTPRGDPAACIEAPVGPWGIGWRRACAACLNLVEFYAPLGRALWWVTPALVLLGQGLPLHADPAVLLAYGVPHLALARLAEGAQSANGRMTLAQWAREWWLEQLLVARTAISFLRTRLTRSLERGARRHDPRQVPATPRPRGSVESALPLLQLIALAGAARMLSTSTAIRWDPAFAIFSAWAFYNLLLSLSLCATVRERSWVLHAQETRCSLEATLRLPDGTLLRATTRNFPQVLLQLTWVYAPADLPHPGTPVHLFVNYSGHELSIQATTRKVQDHGLHVEIAPSDLAEYRAFGQGVFSRQSDWPRWLPSRHADRIVPDAGWAALRRAATLIYDLFISRNVLQTLRERFRLGTHRDDIHHG